MSAVTTVKVLVALAVTVYVPLRNASVLEKPETITLVPTAKAAPAPEAVNTRLFEPEVREIAVTVSPLFVAAAAVVTTSEASFIASTASTVVRPSTEGTST